jgi:hypothetical protein
MYTHKVNILYYNVFTSFWDMLYVEAVTRQQNNDSMGQWDYRPELNEV